MSLEYLCLSSKTTNYRLYRLKNYYFYKNSVVFNIKRSEKDKYYVALLPGPYGFAQRHLSEMTVRLRTRICRLTAVLYDSSNYHYYCDYYYYKRHENGVAGQIFFSAILPGRTTEYYTYRYLSSWHQLLILLFVQHKQF